MAHHREARQLSWSCSRRSPRGPGHNPAGARGVSGSLSTHPQRRDQDAFVAPRWRRRPIPTIMSACHRASGRARSRSGWSRSRCGCSAPPRRRTSPSGRCTARTAAGSATSGSARSTARRCPTPTSPRATSCPTARWSCSTTTTSPTCRSPRPARSRCSASCPPSRSTPCRWASPTTATRPAGRQALRAAARLAGEGRPGRGGQGRAAPARAAGDAARRARACSCCRPCSGRTRCARPSSDFADDGRHGAPAGAGDGRVLHQRAVRRLRAGRVLRRLPRGARGGHRGQGRRATRSRPPPRRRRARPGRSST